jgi:hypothetical protein
MSFMVRFLLFFLIVGTLTACGISNVYKYDAESGYKKSAINEEFIVPNNAQGQAVEFDNPNITKGVKYNLNDIGGDQGLYPPMRYFQDLEKLGWKEINDKRMGHVHYFQKGDTVISVIIKEDFFELYELKNDPEL